MRNFIQSVGGFDNYYDRVTIKGTTYTSTNIETKFNNSCICVNDKYGLIEQVATKNNLAYVICRRIVKLHHLFYEPKNPLYKHSCFLGISDYEFFYVPVTQIRKVFLIKIDDDYYVNYFKSCHLYS